MANKKSNQIIHGNCLEILPTFEADSIDCIVTDPPYGMSFMGKNWDKAVPSVEIWQECLRVLKSGAFAFVMCIPRQDCLSRMIVNLEDAGFNVAFSSLYHCFASGFPKAASISKQIDKRAGVEPLSKAFNTAGRGDRKDLQDAKQTLKYRADYGYKHELKIPQAKAFDGAYSGCQLKPATEIVIVAMRPLEEKTYVDQALMNRHGCTWLDDCRIPCESAKDRNKAKVGFTGEFLPPSDGWNANNLMKTHFCPSPNGRFPANVLCEDDVLSDGRITKSTGGTGIRKETNVFKGIEGHRHFNYGDRGDFSRYFSLDAWFAERVKQLPPEAQKTFPWLIVPKASKSEKNRGLDDMPDKEIYTKGRGNKEEDDVTKRFRSKTKNTHVSVKPIKLLSWLITLGTREGEVVLDPFVGSGTTCIAAKMLNRNYIGIEKEAEYVDIARKRISAIPSTLGEWQ